MSSPAVRAVAGSLGSARRMLLPSVAVVVLLWMPFGFAMTGLIEEWDLLGLFAEHGTFFYTHLDGPLAAHALRPLMPFSFALAHTLSPDSFVGWHVVTMVALVIKGAAMSWLGWRATGSLAAGMLAGVLTLLYPADTMQLSFRSIHINVAGALALTGALFAVKAFDARRPALSMAFASAGSLLFLWAGLIYEVALTLVALPPAVLFARHGLPRPWTVQRAVAALLWLGAPVAYVAYAIWISRHISSYQGAVTGQGSALRHALSVWPDLFDVGAARALFGGWVDAVRMTARTFQSYTYLASASVALAAVCLLAIAGGSRGRRAGVVPDAQAIGSPTRLVVAGLALMLVGYLPYMTSGAHMVISQRTYLWATPGAVLAWVGMLLLLGRAARPVAAGAAMVLMVLGLGAQLFQFHHYVDLSERQRTLLRAVVENFDGNAPRESLLVLDGTSQIGHTWMFHQDGLRYTLTYLYGRPTGPIEVCRVPSMEWQRWDAFGRPGRCSEDRLGWTLSYPAAAVGPGDMRSSPKPPQHIDARQLVLAPIAADGTAIRLTSSNAWRQQLRESDTIAGRRYRALLEERRHGFVAPMFKDQFPSARLRYDFGDWWSLEVVPSGAGWLEAEWAAKGRGHVSMSWKTSREATLYVPLRPAGGPYMLTGRFVHFANDGVRTGMQVRINGQEVPLTWAEGYFAAPVPAGLLFDGRNELLFESAVDLHYYGRSAMIDWVALDPAR
ncbi:hypothetical protein GCM10023165_15630 [Variovorax defluvii]|uniref:Glycosyltransferase RgtA/B/C/D-like domain-containing protein n=2 Tax=Variovorax defluvii TaxID=913761 RepID=A0ABP8HCV9_9BURK